MAIGKELYQQHEESGTLHGVRHRYKLIRNYFLKREAKAARKERDVEKVMMEEKEDWEDVANVGDDDEDEKAPDLVVG